MSNPSKGGRNPEPTAEVLANRPSPPGGSGKGLKLPKPCGSINGENMYKESDIDYVLAENAKLREQLEGQYVLGEPCKYHDIGNGNYYLARNRNNGKWRIGQCFAFAVGDNETYDFWPWTPPTLPEPESKEQFNAYEIPIGTEIVIGKRRWKLSTRQKYHPDLMIWDETTGDEPLPKTRVMYPSEAQWLIDHGAKVTLPEPEPVPEVPEWLGCVKYRGEVGYVFSVAKSTVYFIVPRVTRNQSYAVDRKKCTLYNHPQVPNSPELIAALREQA